MLQSSRQHVAFKVLRSMCFILDTCNPNLPTSCRTKQLKQSQLRTKVSARPFIVQVILVCDFNRNWSFIEETPISTNIVCFYLLPLCIVYDKYQRTG